MIDLSLGRGYVAVIDDEDLDLSLVKWSLAMRNGGAYAMRIFNENGQKESKYLHRVIAERKFGVIPDGILVDHEDRNPLNCRRHNIRLGDYSQAQANQERKSSNKAGYKGVHKRKGHGSWVAEIRFKGKRAGLKYFNTPEKAARQYDQWAKELFGEFAFLNFPNA